jgi:hypothetical protein
VTTFHSSPPLRVSTGARVGLALIILRMADVLLWPNEGRRILCTEQITKRVALTA